MIISLLTGFFANWLPDILGGVGRFFQDKADKKQERAMLKIRLTAEGEQGDRNLEEAYLDADLARISGNRAETRDARRHDQKSSDTMVRLLEATAEKAYKWVVSLVLFMFAFMECLRSSVRPVVTYMFVGYWGSVKMAAADRFAAQADTSLIEALADTWTTKDDDAFGLILGFWFGGKVKEKLAQKQQKLLTADEQESPDRKHPVEHLDATSDEPRPDDLP